MFFITLNEILFIGSASWLCLAINSKFNLSLVLFLILLSGSFAFFCSLWRGVKEWQNIVVMLKLPRSVLWSAAVAVGYLLVGEEPSFNVASLGFADVWARFVGSLALLGGRTFLMVPNAWGHLGRNVQCASSLLSLGKVQAHLCIRNLLFSSRSPVSEPFPQSEGIRISFQYFSVFHTKCSQFTSNNMCVLNCQPYIVPLGAVNQAVLRL